MPCKFRDSAELVESIVHHLDAREYATAVDIISDDANAEHVKTGCWDLIPKLCRNLTNDDKNLNACSRQLLEFLAKNTDPGELILELLEQLDESDDIKFPVILSLLQITLLRCTTNKSNSTEWCLNSVRSYLETVFKNSEEKNDYNCLKEALTATLLFYKQLISNIFKENTNQETETVEILLVSRLIQMCDLLLFDNTIIVDFQEIQSEIIDMILQLMPNPFKLLDHIFNRSLHVRNSRKKSTLMKNVVGNLRELDDDDHDLGFDEQTSPFEDEDVISNLAYSMFFYLLIIKKKNSLPLVYNPKFIFLSTSFLAVPFLEKTNNIAVENGLYLIKFSLDSLPEKELNKYDLCFPHCKTLLVNLNNVMIYSESKENRLAALHCFDSCIACFDWEARYWLLFNLRNNLLHSGTLGHVIMMLKDFLSELLNLSDIAEKFLRYYKGKLLFDLIEKYCFLTEGKKTDLVENADHLISSLNLLRFLVIRDINNITQLKFYIKKIQKKFLEPLKDCCESSKNYYQVLLKNAGSTNEEKRSESTFNVEVRVKDSLLPKLSKEEEKNACFLSLNAIDVIESLLNRLSECINESFSK